MGKSSVFFNLVVVRGKNGTKGPLDIGLGYGLILVKLNFVRMSVGFSVGLIFLNIAFFLW
jgi:hypothetical protein